MHRTESPGQAACRVPSSPGTPRRASRGGPGTPRRRRKNPGRGAKHADRGIEGRAAPETGVPPSPGFAQALGGPGLCSEFETDPLRPPGRGRSRRRRGPCAQKSSAPPQGWHGGRRAVATRLGPCPPPPAPSRWPAGPVAEVPPIPGSVHARRHRPRRAGPLAPWQACLATRLGACPPSAAPLCWPAGPVAEVPPIPGSVHARRHRPRRAGLLAPWQACLATRLGSVPAATGPAALAPWSRGRRAVDNQAVDARRNWPPPGRSLRGPPGPCRLEAHRVAHLSRRRAVPVRHRRHRASPPPSARTAAAAAAVGNRVPATQGEPRHAGAVQPLAAIGEAAARCPPPRGARVQSRQPGGFRQRVEAL